ncbi:MAG: pyridoxal phosphate-dependent aminotransferase [Candidatus Gracilibacteria bacterium]|nr:pyridoxal phosphate-dependent aminotransferase [Candidatus Gracilibacteria bacterium]
MALEKPINLKRGAPELSTIDADLVLGNKPGLTNVNELVEENPFLLGYQGSDQSRPGINPKLKGKNFLGLDSFRETLAELHNVKPEQIVVAGGGMDAMSLVFDAINRQLGEGREFRLGKMAVEQPTYDRILENAKNRRFATRGVRLDTKTGLDLTELEELLKRTQIDLFYGIDPGQNPSSYSYAPEERQEIEQKMAEYGGLVLWDRAYENLRYGESEQNGTPHYFQGPIPDNVIIARNYTKELAAGSAKLGYLILPDDPGILKLFDTVVSNARLNATSYLVSALVNQIIDPKNEEQFHYYSQHLKKLRERFQPRLKKFLEEMQSQFPEARVNQNCDSGYFMQTFYPDIPATPTAQRIFLKEHAEQGLVYEDARTAYTDFYREGGAGIGETRDPFVLMSEEKIPEIVAAKRAAWEKTQEIISQKKIPAPKTGNPKPKF